MDGRTDPLDPLLRMTSAAESMRRAYNRALAKYGNQDPILRDLRWAVGHLAVTVEALVPTHIREQVMSDFERVEREVQEFIASQATGDSE